MYEVSIKPDGIQHFLAVVVVAFLLFFVGAPVQQKKQQDEADFVNFILAGLASALWPWSIWAKIGIPLFVLGAYTTRKPPRGDQDEIPLDEKDE
jgi:hypothetical protein